MILEFLMFGFLLNIISFILNFLLTLTASLRLKEIDAIFKVEALQRLIKDKNLNRPSLKYSGLIPFAYTYWFFVFQISYWNYEGDYIDKLMNYYQHN